MKFLGALCGGIVPARGIVASLWYLAGCETPRGDIGSLSNRRIAAGMGWTGDADELVGWLVESGWLDISPEHRLVIHDWNDHCEEWVRDKVRHAGESIVGHDGSRAMPSNAEARRAKPKKPEDDRGKPPALSLKPLPLTSSAPAGEDELSIACESERGSTGVREEPPHHDPTVQHVCMSIAPGKNIPALRWGRNEPQQVEMCVGAWRNRQSPKIHGRLVQIDEVIRRAADCWKASGKGGAVVGACKWMDELIDNACLEGMWPGQRKEGNRVVETVASVPDPGEYRTPEQRRKEREARGEA